MNPCNPGGSQRLESLVYKRVSTDQQSTVFPAVHRLRGGPGYLQPPSPPPAPEVPRTAHVRAAGRHHAHLRDVPPRAAHPRRRVLRDGPHRPPPAHRRTAVHREVHGADPHRRRRTPARRTARADVRRTARSRGQGQQGRPPPGRPGRQDRRRVRRVPGEPPHRRSGPRTRRQPRRHPHGRRRPHPPARPCRPRGGPPGGRRSTRACPYGAARAAPCVGKPPPPCTASASPTVSLSTAARSSRPGARPAASTRTASLPSRASPWSESPSRQDHPVAGLWRIRVMPQTDPPADTAETVGDFSPVIRESTGG